MAYHGIRYISIREKLNSLGYNLPLSKESVPLVEVLLSGLSIANEKMEQHISLIHFYQQKCQSLELKVKCLEEEIAKGVSENHDLKTEMQIATSKYGILLEGRRKQVAELKENYSELEKTKSELNLKIRFLVETILLQNEKIMHYEQIPKNIRKAVSNLLCNNIIIAGNSGSDVSSPSALNTTHEAENYISGVLSHSTPYDIAQHIETLKAERVNLASSIDSSDIQTPSKDEEINHTLSDMKFPSDHDEELLDDIYNELHLSINKTLALVEAIKALEKQEKQEEKGAASVRNKRLCICEQIIKLQALLIKCECKNINYTEHNLRIRVFELIKACGVLSIENEKLKKEVEEYKSVFEGGINKFNKKGHDLVPKEDIFAKRDMAGIHEEFEDSIKSLLSDLNKIKLERDYYGRECFVLQNHLLTITRCKTAFPDQQWPSSDADIEEMQEKLTLYENEIEALQQNLELEKDQRKIDYTRSQDTIKALELEKNNSSCKQGEMINRIQVLEDTIETLNKKVEKMTNEHFCLQSEYKNIRSCNEHLEIKVKKDEAMQTNTDQELNCALQHIKTLELEKRDEIVYARQEIQSKDNKDLVIRYDNLMISAGACKTISPKCMLTSQLEEENNLEIATHKETCEQGQTNANTLQKVEEMENES